MPRPRLSISVIVATTANSWISTTPAGSRTVPPSGPATSSPSPAVVPHRRMVRAPVKVTTPFSWRGTRPTPSHAGSITIRTLTTHRADRCVSTPSIVTLLTLPSPCCCCCSSCTSSGASHVSIRTHNASALGPPPGPSPPRSTNPTPHARWRGEDTCPLGERRSPSRGSGRGTSVHVLRPMSNDTNTNQNQGQDTPHRGPHVVERTAAPHVTRRPCGQGHRRSG